MRLKNAGRYYTDKIVDRVLIGKPNGRGHFLKSQNA